MDFDHQNQDIPLQDSSEAYAFTNFLETDRDLDDYDRALLAEPQSQLPCSNGGRLETAVSGRVTSSFRPRLSQRRGQAQKRDGTPNGSFALSRHNISRYARVTPTQITTSPSTGHNLSSSPLLDASQRQSARRLARARQIIPEHSAFQKPNSSLDVISGNVNRENLPYGGNSHHTAKSPPSKPFTGMTQSQINLSHAPPVVQGIPLRSLSELPDRLRTVFRFDPFNAIQSKCFPTAYQSCDNLVVAAPTGGGKTTIFELAICNLVSSLNTDQYKVVYMAPTKSLCSERCRDWQTKFAHLDLTCAELTGDTENANLRSVQSANVLITTPEKWDSMTRQWKDHARLMQLVKLFLIDEVHILRESRGATLECVVSRMKSIGSKVRFVALSATVPNSDDVAVWLGKNQDQCHLPAVRETFGEEFRPVTLQKHVIGISYKGNDFGFDSVCDTKILDIIIKYGKRKPVMIFCVTRKAAATTAKYLANIWASKDTRDRPWPGPSQRLAIGDTDLAQTLSSAVAFHHAGLNSTDRNVIERGYLNGDINIICCTSTLAVGINLPCHLVVIKNTLSYQADGLKEYSDLEIMQMLGRAGRPQFDDSAVGVILTKQEKAERYKRLLTGSEMLESCLHLNLIDHVNAEIGLGTIYNLQTAKRWLTGTFLYVRLDKNAEHYKLDGIPIQGSLDEKVEAVCRRSIEDLEGAELVESHDRIQATELGKIMARYYVRFSTMKTFLGLGSRPKMSDILSHLVHAEEFEPIRFRSAEKKLLKTLNGSDGIKYPIKVDIALHAHKRSLLIQVELGGIEFPAEDEYGKHRRQYQQDTGLLFSNVNRLIRCIVDIQIHRRDAVGTRNALELSRSFEAHAWDNSPFQMKQIRTIGSVAIRKLAMSGIKTIEDLEATEPHRIELLLSRNPPYGATLMSMLKDFPKLRVSIKAMGKGSRKESYVEMDAQVELGFMNESSPAFYQRKPVYVCLLTERSDGHLIDFRRISARQLGKGLNVSLAAAFSYPEQFLSCYVMCDAIAGTLRYAEIKPTLPSCLFPRVIAKTSKQVRKSTDTSPATLLDDEFGGDDLSDRELVDMFAGEDFQNIENFENEHKESRNSIVESEEQQDDGSRRWRAVQLPSGKWACNHRCKDKKSCKHLCCHEGLDKKPKPPRAESSGAGPKSSKPLDKCKPNSSGASDEAVKGTERAGIIKRKSPWDTKRLCNPGALNDLEEKLVGKPKSSQARLPAKSRDDRATSNSPHELQRQQEPYSSSNYRSEDLPSPSALLALADNNIQTEANLDDSYFQENVPSSLTDRRSSDRALAVASDRSDHKENQHSKEEAWLSPSKEQTETESRFFASSKDSFGTTSSSDPIQTSTHPRLTDSNPNTGRQQRLFNQSSSPPSCAPPPTKRRKPSEPIIEPSISPAQADVPMAQNHAVASTLAGTDSLPAGSDHKPQPPVIKAGYPAWVYDLDPAFVAEWEDVVEFV